MGGKQVLIIVMCCKKRLEDIRGKRQTLSCFNNVVVFYILCVYVKKSGARLHTPLKVIVEKLSC